MFAVSMIPLIELAWLSRDGVEVVVAFGPVSQPYAHRYYY